jgi:hypothetical protein
MPLFTRTKLGRKQLITPILSYYNPIVYFLPEQHRPNKNLLHKLGITELIAKYIKENFTNCHINLSPDIKDIRSFQQSDFVCKPLYTFTFDLDPSFEPNLFAKEGTSLRKAQRIGIEIKEEFAPNEFISLLNQTNERQNRIFNIPDAKHRELLQKLRDSGHLIQLNAYLNSELVSALLILNDPDKQVLYAWQNGTNPLFLNSGVSLLMHYEVIKQYKNTHTVYDLCGGNHSSISRFKTAMGADLKLFFRLEYKKSRIPIPKLR